LLPKAVIVDRPDDAENGIVRQPKAAYRNRQYEKIWKFY
jgi:hypothetical protein